MRLGPLWFLFQQNEHTRVTIMPLIYNILQCTTQFLLIIKATVVGKMKRK